MRTLSFLFAFSMLLKLNLYLFVAIEFGTQVPFRSELFYRKKTECVQRFLQVILAHCAGANTSFA